MKANFGKQTGIALALLATLLATFLAMGVFSVAQAQETNPQRNQKSSPNRGNSGPWQSKFTVHHRL